LVRILLPLHLPVALLEGFAEYRKAVLAFPVARPKVVYSANSLHSHLAWKLLVAEWRQQGTLLLYHQHGGGYGAERLHPIEEFETRVVDRYYTLGWRRDQPHIKPLSPPQINAPTRLRKRLLLCCLDMPRVVYRLHFQPMPGTIETMHRETCEFLAGVPDRRHLLIRPYSQDYGWGAVDMMRKAAPDAKFDDRKKSAAIRFAESRLVIHNYLGTGWLETLALDIPTVCFYDPETYAFREAVQPYIDALEKIGVLHHSGNSAALFVASLADDIEK
jgi:putative transferase (TIGR04331 family)